MSHTAAPTQPSSQSRKYWPVKFLGWVCILFGIVILGGGIWLITLGGSWYYGLAGLGLIATGVLLNRHSLAAVWVYLIVWAGTLIWSWWEVQMDWWAHVPRVVAPTVILLLVLCCIPFLRSRRARRGSAR